MNRYEIGSVRSKYLFLLPGMMSPVAALFPLQRYLQTSLIDYDVRAIALNLSITDFSEITEKVTKTIVDHLIREPAPTSIILFGHSHGGRVAAEVISRLKSKFPARKYFLVTAGTPMTNRPNYLPWYQENFFKLSRAYRAWPSIIQPENTISKQIGFYSLQDKVVIPEFAQAGYHGELRELTNLSHHDLIVPKKVGSIYAMLIKDFN